MTKIDLSGPIGVFDSGLGGLTVLKELLKILPNENTVYFGDNGRAPYGTKSPDTIIHFAQQDASFLQSKGVKIIVIACNTAGSYAYSILKERCNIPVIEVITPGAKAAIKSTKNGRIGVIGTSATISSNMYEKSILSLASADIKVFSSACPLFVGLAEEGWWNDEVTDLIASRYLSKLKEADVDTVVLGCTHYPLLQDSISRVMGKDVTLINSASEVALKVAQELKSNKLENIDDTTLPRYNHYFTSDSEEKFKSLGSTFLNLTIDNAIKIDIEKYLPNCGN